MNIFDLMAKIGLDTSEYDSGLDSSEQQFESFGSKVKNGLKNVASVTAGAVKAVASGVSSMAKSMYNSTAELANYGDSIDKASQKIGISAKAYQEWEAVMQHSGTSMESMTASFKTLANASQGATDEQAAAFAKLGMSLDEISSMSTEDLFSRTIAGLQGMEESSERTAIASSLLGRGAMELGALLNTSAEDTKGMIDEVNRLGGVMSDEAVKSSAEFNDNLQDMTTAIDSVKRGITAEFLPGLSLLMKGFTGLITGADNARRQLIAGFGRVAEGLKDNVKKVGDIATTLIPVFVSTALSMLPQLGALAIDIIDTIVNTVTGNISVIVDTATTLITTLADGLIVALPQLATAAIDIVLTLVDRITEEDMLDKLIDASIVLIIALADGLIEATPRLIEKIPDIVTKLVDAIVRNAPKLLSAAAELITKLVAGIIDNVPRLFKAGNDAVNAVRDGVMDLIGGAKTWGKDLISNFVDGIKANWNKLKSAVSDVAQSVKDLIGFSEPKKGPLSNFHTYAPDMMDLFAKGIRDNTVKITGSLESSLTDVKGTFRNANSGSVGGGNTFNITVSSGTIASDYDAYRAAQLISEQLAQLQTAQRIGLGGTTW